MDQASLEKEERPSSSGLDTAVSLERNRRPQIETQSGTCKSTPLSSSTSSSTDISLNALTAAAVVYGQHSTRGGNSKKQTPEERLNRSRERNRMHARKTRQRKKEQMQNLQNRAEELKAEQIRLRQVINEKNTANILVGLFSTAEENNASCDNGRNNKDVDTKVEELLGRPVEEIPDSSKISELPSLILPGQYNSKKRKELSLDGDDSKGVALEQEQDSKDLPNDGIDYDLLGKDRSKCSAAELDKIRRERNRMHAKRTRDRKRLFMEEMGEVIKRLEGENELLKKHVEYLDPDHDASSSTSAPASENTTPSLMSPATKPATDPSEPPTTISLDLTVPQQQPEVTYSTPSSTHLTETNVPVDQIKSMLQEAGAFDRRKSSMGLLTIMSVASVVSAVNSDHESSDDDDILSHGFGQSPPPSKRPRLESLPSTSPNIVSSVPSSITC